MQSVVPAITPYPITDDGQDTKLQAATELTKPQHET